MAEQCTATLEGPKAHGVRNSPTWRRRCKGVPMLDRAELVGWVPGRCFQHQPAEVRNAVYRERAEAQAATAREYQRVHGHWPGEAGQ